MSNLNEFYEVSKTDESIFDEEQIAIIEQILAMVTDTQLLATAQYLIDLFAVKNDSRVLRRHANRLLLELAEEGSAEHQCLLGEHLLNRVIAPPQGEYSAELAHTWLQKAYDQGFGRAAYALGYFYEENRKGFPKDEEKSAFYREEAKRLGYTVNST
jgi:TPR repeat protein